MRTKYRGWTNYETYAVFHFLWFNEAHFVHTVRIVTEDTSAATELPKALRAYVEGNLGEHTGDPPTVELVDNLLKNVLNQVDWFEVAGNIRAEVAARTLADDPGTEG